MKPNRYMFKIELKEAFISFIQEKGFNLLEPIPPYEVIRAINSNLIGPTSMIIIYQRAKSTGFYTIQPQTEPIFKEFLSQHPST